MKNNNEKTIKELFHIWIIIKWIFASLEFIAGFIILFISQNIITKGIIAITQGELTEDPKDYIFTQILQFGTNLSFNLKLIIAAYFMIFGIIKLCLLYGLWKDKLKVYPISAGFFSLFIIYQLYKYNLNHSLWLLILSLFDIISIYLIMHEYKIIKKTRIS